MANNQNQTLNYRQIESDFKKAKIAKPPRNKSKEVDIYLYISKNKLEEVLDKTAARVISAVFEKSIKLNSTTPLNSDLIKPKFADISDSATWGSQLNGFIYESIDFNPDDYSFITFELLQTNTITKTAKYRIVDYSPVYDNNNNFLYASVSFIRETSKTIPGIDKITWQLTTKLIFDKNTKYLKFTLPPETQIHAGGLRVTTLDENGVRRNDGFSINHISELGYKLVKYRSLNPVRFDDKSLDNFKELNIGLTGNDDSITVEGRNSIDGLIRWRNDGTAIVNPNPEAFPSSFTITTNRIEANVGGTDIDDTWSAVRDYFSKAFNFSGRENSVIEQKILTANDATLFLTGGVSFDGQTIPSNDDEKLNTTDQRVLIVNLNPQTENDRKYFVMTKPTDLTKVVKIIKYSLSATAGVTNQYKAIYMSPTIKTTLLTPEEATTYFQDKQENIIIEVELLNAGKEPRIDFSTSIAKEIYISTYDENHNLLLDNVKVNTEYKFDNSVRKTVIQL